MNNTDLSTTVCPYCSARITGGEEAVRIHRHKCYLALAERENAEAAERIRPVDPRIPAKVTGTCHDAGLRTGHVGDRQLSTMMDEVRRLTARVKELEAENQRLKNPENVLNGLCKLGWLLYGMDSRNSWQDVLDRATKEHEQNQRLRELLRPFAFIRIPADADDDSWLSNYLTDSNDPLVAAVRRAAEELKLCERCAGE